MQQVLSIDISVEPAQAVVTAIDGVNIKVLERESAALGELFSRAGLRATGGLQPTAAPASEAQAAQPGAEPEPAPAAQPAEASQGIFLVAAEENMESAAAQPLENPFDRLLQSINSDWTSAVLIVPAYEYLSLNVRLPFRDSKKLRGVLNLEVQDLVPFDISEFFLQHQTIAPTQEQLYDIHVSLIPRLYVSAILKICRAGGFEPLIMTTPPSVLGALYYLNSGELAPDSAVAYLQDGRCHLCAAFDGQVRCERIINADSFRHRGQQPLEPRATLLAELKSSLNAFERRYQKQLSSVYLLGNGLKPQDLEKHLNRPVDTIDPARVVTYGQTSDALACLAGVFAQDFNAPRVLTNFRSGEFAYSPQLKELLRAAKALAPYALAVLLAAAVFVAGTYYAREQRLHKLQAAVADQIQRVVPDLGAQPGSELQALQSRSTALQQELQALGSPARLSPLDAFLQLSKDFPDSKDIQVRRLKITPDSIEVSGTVPDFTAVQKIKRLLRRQKDLYCEVEQDTTASSYRSKGFTFKIKLCPQ